MSTKGSANIKKIQQENKLGNDLKAKLLNQLKVVLHESMEDQYIGIVVFEFAEPFLLNIFCT